MKKSDELKIQASQEENDIKAFSLYKKALREKRSEKFEEWLKIIQVKYPVEVKPNGAFSIITQDYGIVDYFPKANNLLIRKLNKWRKPGLKWIIKNLLKE